ncbi:MAG: hydrogenase maturation protease [Propionibacteriaceae bacterium]|jgi:hydrogenase maturation protease|nr:hydrogenase maturation protease [Propionibacteriaceae bacterium]
MTEQTTGIAVTVLGVGNPIMADDGVGLELLAQLELALPDPRVDYVWGGTGGLELLGVLQDSQRLLILDAIAGPTPGQVVEVTGDQIKRLLAAKLSPHQIGLLDVFSAARLTGREPEEVTAIGIVPEIVEMRVGLTEVVAAAIPQALEQAIAQINRWLTNA